MANEAANFGESRTSQNIIDLYGLNDKTRKLVGSRETLGSINAKSIQDQVKQIEVSEVTPFANSSLKDEISKYNKAVSEIYTRAKDSQGDSTFFQDAAFLKDLGAAISGDIQEFDERGSAIANRGVRGQTSASSALTGGTEQRMLSALTGF